MEFERRTLLVQFIALDPLTFYATADGTDLVQDILRARIPKSEANLFGQEGSASVDDHGEFLTFEPTDTKNRSLHLPVEHLAYCGALRRMRRSASDQRNPDQNCIREFENTDLANRYPQDIMGPPIFVAIFHGFDNALCYTFVTQSADDACLLVSKLMRAFRNCEQQQLAQQGHANQGFPSNAPIQSTGLPSHINNTHVNPFPQLSQPLFTEQRQIHSSPLFTPLPTTTTTTRMYFHDPCQDDLLQSLLSNPNLQIVNQPCSSSHLVIGQQTDPLSSLLPPSSAVRCCSLNDPLSSIVTQQTSPVLTAPTSNNGVTQHIVNGFTPLIMRAQSPPIINFPDTGNLQYASSGSTTPPQIIHKPSNQDITYKQNIIVRWLKPPTPPPPAPIIIREIESPPEIPPPIVCRHVAPCPPTPPPIVVREKPPPCCPPGPPVVIEKHLPRTCLPRQVIVERCPPPPPKPRTIIYEKYLPPPQQQRKVIVQRETCQPTTCRRLVREVVRQVPQCTPAQPALVCRSEQQQQIVPGQSQVVQQYVPVFATKQHVVQPKGVRVIRQVVGPAQPSVAGSAIIQQQPAQFLPAAGSSLMQAAPTALIR